MREKHFSIPRTMKMVWGAAAAVALMAMAPGTGNDVIHLATTAHTARLDVQALDDADGLLRDALVIVDHEGVEMGRFKVADKARVSFEVDLGNLYGITVTCPGFFNKRFIFDARTDDVSKIHPGPFSAEVNMMSTASVGDVETDLFDMPYAMVVYSKNDRAFVVDQDYLRQTKQLEAALLLKVARAQRQASNGSK